jgi:hypothetical protein
MMGAVANKGWLAALAGVCLIALGSSPVAAQPAPEPAVIPDPKPLVQPPPRRARRYYAARPRIEVRPRYPYRSFHTLYPLPYDVEYPGPNARRDCETRLVTEYRPSGTVVVPRMHCWWVRG